MNLKNKEDDTIYNSVSFNLRDRFQCIVAMGDAKKRFLSYHKGERFWPLLCPSDLFYSLGLI